MPELDEPDQPDASSEFWASFLPLSPEDKAALFWRMPKGSVVVVGKDDERGE